MHFSTIITPLILATLSLANPLIARGKPTGGPAVAKITVYNSYKCVSPTTVPPTDGSAGVSNTISIAEATCSIMNIPFGGAITAALTAPPKTGAPGCFVQIHTQSGCGLTLNNEYHGFPFDGTIIGSKVGCVSPPVQAYGAIEITCG
ncbi:hypothetical protein ONS95_010871 [Cadophora gregata]|uniref:uncharacterized protein n=1 Tax=Cadophora gregata TaxID=51156 RepID=UPI0026DC28AF|nr:uncharacterized protein ONS95_010871 [Cadophora gregata]KAK0119419.1 hypothetical protein ONS95_010871 [Cadophora gregata]KAK0120456.1 hypothetical protein ONS96_010670 [Cadophora gregata f. sp. sojae]